MTRFILSVLACLVCIFQRTYAVCPPITGEQDKAYAPGQTLMIWCDNKPNLRYTATCKNDGIWDHSRKESDCAKEQQPANVPKPAAVVPVPASSNPMAPKPVVNSPMGAPQLVVPAKPDPKPAVIASTGTNPVVPAAAASQNVAVDPAPRKEGCQFLPTYMRDGDVELIFREGAQYNMICDDRRQLFLATCANNAWIYETNYCKGPVRNDGLFMNLFGPVKRPGPVGSGSPAIQKPVRPVQPGDGKQSPNNFFDGIAKGLDNLFKPLTAPRQPSENTGNGLDLFRGLDQAFNNLFGGFNRGGMESGIESEGEDLKPCAYDPRHIRQEDSGIPFSHGFQYRAPCKQNNNRLYPGICRDGRWIFDEEVCTRPANNPFGSILDGLDDAFNGLFNRNSNRNSQVQGRACAYDPLYIAKEHDTIPFYHGYQYRKLCKNSRDRYYPVGCYDGQWRADEQACTRPNNPLGNLFSSNENGFPLWLLLG